MTAARRRAPRTPEQRLAQSIQSLIPGTRAGGVANASPVVPGLSAQRAAARVGQAFGGAGGSTLFARDRFPVTVAGAQTKTLTYLPVAASEHVYLNGLEQDEGLDWVRPSTSRDLTIQAAMGPVPGDVVEVRYAYQSGVPAAPGAVTLGALRYKQEATDGPDYSATAYDDSAWPVGVSAWGSPGVAGDDPVNTPWSLNTYMWVRFTATGSGTFGGRVDNDIRVWRNGVQVFDAVSEDFTGVWSVTVGSGDVVAIRARDRGTASYLSVGANR